MSGYGSASGAAGPLSLRHLTFLHCPEVTKYEKLVKIGQGTFGEVYKARDRKTDKTVALKKLQMENEKEGFPMTALRAIRVLQQLKHENVVNLVEVCRGKQAFYNRDKGSLFLVLDFCEHDLAGFLGCKEIHFSLGQIKKLLQQLFKALLFIHGNNILHRDVKSSNVLITRNGVLKLAGFGLARAMSSGAQQRYTSRVVTLWYRPPELILGERSYTSAIDMWGAGCIMAEMWTRQPIMQGDTEQKQISLISQLCGSINPQSWPDVEKLELYHKLQLPQDQNREVKDRLRHYVEDSCALDLLDNLLVVNPRKRLDSDKSLNHDFFLTDPLPSDLAPALATLHSSMFAMYTSSRWPPPEQPTTAAAGGGGTPEWAMHDRVF